MKKYENRISEKKLRRSLRMMRLWVTWLQLHGADFKVEDRCRRSVPIHINVRRIGYGSRIRQTVIVWDHKYRSYSQKSYARRMSISWRNFNDNMHVRYISKDAAEPCPACGYQRGLKGREEA